MIKAEDLRIGDLVIVSKTGCKIPKGTVCRVTAIETESMLFDDGFVSVRLIPIDPKCKQISWYDWCKNISTIPLTPEILEKNGWKRISHKGLPWALFRKKVVVFELPMIVMMIKFRFLLARKYKN